MGQGRRTGGERGRETIRMTGKDKGKERNTVYPGKKEIGVRERKKERLGEMEIFS